MVPGRVRGAVNGGECMQRRYKDTNRLISDAIDQMTPEMDHVCILASATFVKFTRIIHVVCSETQLRDQGGPRCPPGSKDLGPDVAVEGPANGAHAAAPAPRLAGCGDPPAPARARPRRRKP